MKILITGATGFIGSHLADALCKRGHAVSCPVRKTSNLRWLEHTSAELSYGDLFDIGYLRTLVTGVDCVYHVAGITKARTKEEYFRGNHLATKNLLEAVAEANPGIKRFIHVSSQAAVGPSVKGQPVDERTPFHPITTYGVSKMEAEKECMRLANRLPITIVRPPAVYGPRDKDVFEFFNTINKGLQPIVGFGDRFVSLIHVKDLVDGIILAGEHEAATGNTYFISSERAYHWREVGEIASRVVGKKVFRLRVPEMGIYTIAAFSELFGMMTNRAALINFEKAKDIVQRSWTCSVQKAQTELGFRESFTLEEGMIDAVGWYREHGWLR